MRIKAYLYLMAAAILVPVILFAGLTLRLLQQSETEQALAGLGQAARGAALLVEDELADAEEQREIAEMTYDGARTAAERARARLTRLER